MQRKNKTITISLPVELADRVAEVSKQKGLSRSEFLREAVDRYVQEYEWRQLVNYGERRVREMGIRPEDAIKLVEEYRAEVNSPSP